MKLGIFGGSFDPIHIGHQILAETVSQESRLDHVLFIPSAVSPHKTSAPPADPRHRITMVRHALSGTPNFSASDLEIRTGGPSYTIDTVRTLQKQYPRATLFLMMGSDTARDLPKWKEFASLGSLVQFLIATRPDAPLSSAPLRTLRHTLVEIPQIGISSGMIRERLRRRQSIHYLVPKSVEQYIIRHNLYRH